MILVVAGAVTAGALAALSLTGQRDMDAETFQERLVTCIGDDSSPGTIDEAQERCAREVLLSFSARRQPGEVHDALADLYYNHQPFASICHNISHYAGVLFAQRDGAAAEDLPAISSEICVTGILHGFMETVGFSRPDDAAVDRYIAACTSLRDELRMGCADGVGHMLYIREPDLTRSAAKCVELARSGERIQCSYGVIMFAGQLRPGAYPERPDLAALDVDDLPEICERWPVDGAVGQYGCGMGLANLLVFPTGAQHQMAQLTAGGGNIDDDTPQARAVTETLEGIYAACMGLRSVPARLACLNDAARNMSRTHEYRFAAFDAACALLPAGYEIACPRNHNAATMHDAGAHLQVEEHLRAEAGNDGP